MKPRHATASSKEVLEGSIFFARKGEKVDGHNFVKQAIERGATCIYYSSKLPFETINYKGVEFIFDKNLEANLPDILKEMYDLPNHLVGITGTNGKTSTAFLSMQALGMLGKKAGFIGTLGVFLYDGKIKKLEESELTTPDTISFYYYLALLKSRGVEVACFEASSIGLVGGRIRGVEVDVACITNFTQDHLDFHKTMESYFEAKSLLFLNHLKKNGLAIAGSSIFEKMKAVFPATTSLKELEEEKITPEGSEFKFEEEKFVLNLAGRFQLENIGFVLEICKYFGFNIKQIAEIFPKLLAPKGRLECVHKKPYIFVDYAHTPDSLLKAITTLKEGLVGKIIVVFGCGGNRDASKRPIMGKLACENADFSIITDDNPRTESPEEIRRQIISGFLTNNFIEIGDRSEAIKKAVEIAKPDDVILIAGKGHENYQIIGETKYNFDDAKCVKLLFQK